jgi:hypothetical protein
MNVEATHTHQYMSDDKRELLEKLLQDASEAYLASRGVEELKSKTQLKSNGTLLLMFDGQNSLLETLALPSSAGPGKFQFLPSEGVAFLYEQMSLPPPPGITFDPKTQCVVVAVVCLNEGEGEEPGTIYQNMFVYTY